MRDYYARRASEYDRIYEKPERQRDLADLRTRIRAAAAGRRVIEIACGTGYWTEVLSSTAESLLATDAVADVLRIAQQRIGRRGVRFALADAYASPFRSDRFDLLFCGFLWSHVALGRLTRFLEALHTVPESGAALLFIDNRYVEGSSTPIAERDLEGNTFQRRRLEDGAEFRILKNFPTASELTKRASDAGFAKAKVEELQHYWILSLRS